MHRPTMNFAKAGLIADWSNVVFLHFALPPAELARHLPWPLDLHEGLACVSLVSFRLERLRPAGRFPKLLGRCLLRPFSDHEFLNLRTYVRGPVGTGILFCAEWITRRASLGLGPPIYGLPYRLASIERRTLSGGGLRRIAVQAAGNTPSACFIVPDQPDHAAGRCLAGSLDEFLLERYIAYTHRRHRARYFRVHHDPWVAGRFDLARFDAGLLTTSFPWFNEAQFIGGHLAADVREAVMSPPHRLAPIAETLARTAADDPVFAETGMAQH